MTREQLERKRLRQRLWARAARRDPSKREKILATNRAWKQRMNYRDSDTRDYSQDWTRRKVREAWNRWVKTMAASRVERAV